MLRINVPGRWKLLRFRALYLGTGHYLPGGEGYYFFEKWLEKNMTLPLQHDKKNYDPPPAKSEKNCDPPPIPFFYFHLIFFNKNNIFYKKMCSLQQLFCIFWKSWKAVFLHSQAKEADHSQPFVLYVFDDIFWPVFSSEGPSWSTES